MNYLIALTLTLGSASAAPFLKTKADFATSTFCKAHACKLVATVPSNTLDQVHYDVDNRYRVVVWRIPKDPRRVGPVATTSQGRVNGISMIWYGVQDTPFGSEKVFAELVSFASGKVLTSQEALKWLDDSRTELRYWGNFAVIKTAGALPGENAGILEFLVSVNDPN